ncbi:MAG: hypothetical protein LPJ95_06980 [Paracoccaceae bacterium]|nr:hypothetical protein [Paracoccaceae bacterium]
MSRFLPAVSALLLSSFPASALTLECRIPPTNAGGGYVTGVYVFQHEAGSTQAIVSDEVIMYFNAEQPMKAKVTSDTAKKLVFSWNVLMTNAGQTTRMQYRAAYFKETGAVTIRAKPGGYTNDFEGRGACRAL